MIIIIIIIVIIIIIIIIIIITNIIITIIIFIIIIIIIINMMTKQSFKCLMIFLQSPSNAVTKLQICYPWHQSLLVLHRNPPIESAICCLVFRLSNI